MHIYIYIYTSIYNRGAFLEHSPGEMLKLCFQGWLEAAAKDREARTLRKQERAQRKKMMEEWVEKKRLAVERANKRREETVRKEPPPSRQAAEPQSPSSRGSSDARGARSPRRVRVVGALPEIPGTWEPTDGKDVDSLQRAWPTPRPSPFYKLRVWDVLAKVGASVMTSEQPMNRSRSCFLDLGTEGRRGEDRRKTRRAATENLPALSHRERAEHLH